MKLLTGIADILRRATFSIKTPLNTPKKDENGVIRGAGINIFSRRYRFLLWFARRICKIPYTVNFNKPDSEEFYAVAFAASPEAVERVRGDDMLIQRLAAANQTIAALSGNRKSRRLLKQAARGAAKKEMKNNGDRA